jgi:hypothetical protein
MDQSEKEKCVALGWAMVAHGSVCDGPLSAWHEASLAQRIYHQETTNAYTVRVLHAKPFANPFQLFLRKDGVRGREVAIQLTPQNIVFQPSAQSALEKELRNSAGVFPIPRYAVQVPMSVGDLVVAQTNFA